MFHSFLLKVSDRYESGLFSGKVGGLDCFVWKHWIIDHTGGTEMLRYSVKISIFYQINSSLVYPSCNETQKPGM